MLAVILTIIALVVIHKVTNKILSKHPCKNKLNLGIGASCCILIFASIFFLTSYLVKSGADELNKMRSTSYFMSFFAGEEIVGDLLSAADEYGIDIDEESGGVGEMPDDFRLMIDNVHDNFSYSVWCLLLILAAFCVNVYGIMKTNKVVIWSSLAVMAIALIISGRLAGACSFHLLNFSTSGLYNPYDGDTSKSLLIPFFTIVAVIIAIGCSVSGFRKTKALVEYNSEDKKVFNARVEPQINYSQVPINSQTGINNRSASSYKEKAKRLQEIKELYDVQALTQEEYEKMKHQILNS